MCGLQGLLPLCRLSFCFLDNILRCTSAFNCIKFNLSIFSFIAHALISNLRIQSQIWDQKSLFFSKSFIVLPFILRSLTHYELNLVYGVKLEVQLHSFILSPLLDNLGTFAAKQLAKGIWVYFWILDAILLAYIFILIPVHTILIIVAL